MGEEGGWEEGKGQLRQQSAGDENQYFWMGESHSSMVVVNQYISTTNCPATHTDTYTPRIRQKEKNSCVFLNVRQNQGYSKNVGLRRKLEQQQQQQNIWCQKKCLEEEEEEEKEDDDQNVIVPTVTINWISFEYLLIDKNKKHVCVFLTNCPQKVENHLWSFVALRAISSGMDGEFPWKTASRSIVFQFFFKRNVLFFFFLKNIS